MQIASPPRDYPDWRAGEDRPEDAAYLFGYYLILNCRQEALATLPPDASPVVKAAVEEAVDTALHNVCDMLEGFFPLLAGRDHFVDLALGVRVYSVEEQLIETIVISPGMLDLPVGYWKWAKERNFRSSS